MPRPTDPPAGMLTVEDALARVLALCATLPPESKPPGDAAGQVLAQDIVAPFDLPPADNSAMDGYAVRTADIHGATLQTPVPLTVISQIAAGALYNGPPLAEGQVVRIMTGAPIPSGADVVVPFEQTDEVDRDPAAPVPDTIQIRGTATAGVNIRPRGEDVASGETILPTGMRIGPAQIAVLASLGVERVQVIRRPRVAILATGDELVPVGQPLPPGKIYDSNTAGVAAQVREFGGDPLRLGIARDTLAEVRAKLRDALPTADLIVTSAGVSRGDFDVVKEALAQEGAIQFWTVRMRPGKPLAFGTFSAPDGRTVPHLGLPGNPVAALVVFELFGRAAIHKLLGRPPSPRRRVRAVLQDRIQNHDGRRVYARVSVTQDAQGGWQARSAGGQGSHVLSALAAANGLAICPEDMASIEPGETCDVIFLE